MVALEFISLCLLVLVGVAVAPALAVYPKLLLRPRWANAVPLLSILLVTMLARSLITADLYSHEVVLAITFLAIAVAAFRVPYTLWHGVHHWRSYHGWLLLLNVSVILPLAVSLALSAFVRGDGLSSWNYWALQYFFQHPPDQNTMAALYPQMYPLLLSYGYKLLGSIQLQGPLRLLLALFPWSVLNSIALSTSERSLRPGLYLVSALIAIFPVLTIIKGFNYYLWGYADPMMTAAYIAALSFYLSFSHYRERLDLYLFAGCSIVAALSKQPGLLLACVSGPALLAFDAYWQKRWDKHHVMALMLMVLPIAGWFFSSHVYFFHNQGVLNRSLTGETVNITSMMTTFGYSCYRYLIQQPQLLLLFVAGLASTWFDRRLRAVALVSIVPGWLLWFVFGSYHFRLGLHVTAQLALMLAASDYILIDKLGQKVTGLPRIKLWAWPVTAGSVLLSILLLGLLTKAPYVLHSSWQVAENHLLDSSHLILHRNFGNSTTYIRQNLYNQWSDAIWASNTLIAGIFYGHAPLVTEGHHVGDPEKLLALIAQRQPVYLIDPGNTAQKGGRALRHLAGQCPRLFKPIALPDAVHNFKLYRLRSKQIATCRRNIKQGSDKP